MPEPNEVARRAAHHGPMPRSRPTRTGCRRRVTGSPPTPRTTCWTSRSSARPARAALDRGLITEWWSGADRVFLTWCAECRWTGNVVLFARAVIEEPEH